MQIIVRQANFDFDALKMAQGMENAGADVFSITYNSSIYSISYSVYAKYEYPVTSKKIDKQIEIQFRK